MLAVPLLDAGALLGVLSIEHPEPRGFNESDKALLETLSVPAIIAFHTVDLYKQLERRIRHQSSLNLIAARVQEKSYDLDTISRLFLTGITAGEGLGFSRAMLFLTNLGDGALRGQSAIGPITREEALAVWDSFAYGGPSATLDALLQQAEQFSYEIKEGKIEDSPLSLAAQKVSFPITSLAGAAAECLLRSRAIIIGYGQPDPFRKVLGRLTKPDDIQHAFACAPLIGKMAKKIGALVVDNRFSFQERTVDPEDVTALEAFAGFLALSIETLSRLQVFDLQRGDSDKSN